MSVVDPQLRVHGLKKLRVIDASVMPTLSSGNINAAVMMIGEKGADLVKAGYAMKQNSLYLQPFKKKNELIRTAKAMMIKGLLAMDESIPTCNKRFTESGIPQTEEYRRNYHELLITTPGLGSCISGDLYSYPEK